ncbi:DUF6049 family protein [Microbacterium betulae]|uniref:DUF6049 family protein n=1 Tax=Microbacterium betulae TaxID=2981139 RepID=A0AA97FI89_9MICO|nr:DUF6049 family protein [Microbacterium sp. AB]WOF23059.1 DUF6049 family protein [Microbacterium sp. AB]
MTQRRTAVPPRRPRRLVAPAAVVAFVALLGAAPPAAAETADPTQPARQLSNAAKESADDTEDAVGVPAEAEEDDSTRPSLALLPANEGVVGASDDLVATLTIENPGTAQLAAGSIELSIGASALSDRSALDGWLASGEGDPALTSLQTASTAAIAGGGSITTSVSVPEDAEGLQDLGAGVYPLQATYTSGSATLQASSVVVVASDERAPVAVVVPVTAPVTSGGLLTAEELTALTGADGALGRLLGAVTGTGAVLAIDPAVPAAIRALGSSAPGPALEWLSRLERLPNERFALQFGDADVAAQVQAGVTDLLAPTSLRAYESGEDFEQAVETPTPTATPQPDEASAYPSLDELLAIGEETATAYWPVEGAAGADVVDALNADGAVTLIPSTTTAEGADGTSVAARAEGALVYDDAVSDALSAAALDDDDRESELVATSAALWFASREVGDGPLLVALDRTTYPADDTATDAPGRTEESLRDALEVVTRNASVDTRSLTDLLAATPQDVTVSDAAPVEERTAAVSSLTAADAPLAQTATALDEPELLTGQARAETLQLLAVGWSEDLDRWRSALAAHAETTAARIDGVGVSVSDQVQLLSAEAPLPVWVRNDLAWPITVVLQVEPNDARIDVQERIEIEVPAGSNPRSEIPVESRIGSGEVQLSVTLLTTSGQQLGPVQTMDVTVRADWERIGLGALIGLIVLLVVGGVVRTVLRRRRAHADEDADGEESDAADEGGQDHGKKVASDE